MQSKEAAAPPPASMPDDAEVIAKAMRAKNGEKFTRLWAGDFAEYPFEHEADAALCCMLAYWVGPDAERIERLFSQSGLAKGRQWAKQAGYRKLTIEAAIKNTRDFGRFITRGSRTTQDDSGKVIIAGRRLGKAEDKTPGTDSEAVQMAEKLAAKHSPSLPAWQASFMLARRLRNLSEENPKQFEKAVTAYCQKIGRGRDDVWHAFLRCWDKVLLNEGEGPLEWAALEAAKSPITIADSLSETYAKVASLAYHLTRITGPKPFWLPRKEVADLLGTYPNDISNVVALLVDEGILECVDANYSYRGRKAKEYLFVGGPPGGSTGQAANSSAE